MADKINISGNWVVTVSQKIKKKNISYKVHCTIAQVDTRVIGTFYYVLSDINFQFKSSLKNKKSLKIPFEGHISNNQLQLSYRNADKKIQQLGAAILEIKTKSSIQGPFVGYGPESGGHISGTLKFTRLK